jgi:type IVB pilus formation R64 PilN family outer membrane protein
MLLASGCAMQSGASEDLINGKQEDLATITKSKIVSVLPTPYLGAKPVNLPKNSQIYEGAFAKTITLNQKGNLNELCAQISQMTGIPISVQILSKAPKNASSSSNSLDAQLNQALGGGYGINTHGRFRLAFTGTVKEILDVLALRSGLIWDYTPGSGVVFSDMMVKTFTIWAAPGKVSYENTITNQSKDSTAMSGSGTSGTSVQDTAADNAQTNTTELQFDVWRDIQAEIKSLLSPEGSVSINLSAGTITVRDTPYALMQIEKYITETNEKLARQVALSIKVWSLEVDDSAEAGINLSVFFENSDFSVVAGAAPFDLLTAGGSLTAAIVDGKMKGSSALLKGLRSYGNATQVTSGGGIVMNNQPVPIQAIRRDVYLASSSQSYNDYGDTTALTPGEVTTGFAMTVIPHILDGRRVALQYSINLSSLDDLGEFTSGDSTIQLPKVSTRSFSQRMTLKMGQTLVLAGFEQEVDGRSKQGGLFGFGVSREYRKSLIIITISAESGDV